MRLITFVLLALALMACVSCSEPRSRTTAGENSKCNMRRMEENFEADLSNIRQRLYGRNGASYSTDLYRVSQPIEAMRRANKPSWFEPLRTKASERLGEIKKDADGLATMRDQLQVIIKTVREACSAGEPRADHYLRARTNDLQSIESKITGVHKEIEELKAALECMDAKIAIVDRAKTLHSGRVAEVKLIDSGPVGLTLLVKAITQTSLLSIYMEHPHNGSLVPSFTARDNFGNNYPQFSKDKVTRDRVRLQPGESIVVPVAFNGPPLRTALYYEFTIDRNFTSPPFEKNIQFRSPGWQIDEVSEKWLECQRKRWWWLF